MNLGGLPVPGNERMADLSTAQLEQVGTVIAEIADQVTELSGRPTCDDGMPRNMLALALGTFSPSLEPQGGAFHVRY